MLKVDDVERKLVRSILVGCFVGRRGMPEENGTEKAQDFGSGSLKRWKHVIRLFREHRLAEFFLEGLLLPWRTFAQRCSCYAIA